MNNFAIIYAGTDLTVAAKMVALKSNILREYPKINLWYVFDKDIKYFFQEFPLVIDFQTYQDYKNNFTKIYKLENNTKTDCILDFCNENNTDCTQAQDRNVTIPDYMFAEIEQMTQQELMTLAKVPSDTGDNSQNILR